MPWINGQILDLHGHNDHLDWAAISRPSCAVSTVVVGRRHSVDVQFTRIFDAAHLFVLEAKKKLAGLLV